jgi:hypothetical protein
MAVRAEFGARRLYGPGLLRVPEEADPVAVPDQFTGDAEGRRQVSAGVERCEEKIRHWNLPAVMPAVNNRRAEA